MRCYAFALRNTRELVRDKLTVAFSLGFPIVLLLLLSLIQANIPVSLFEIEHLTPGIAVFGLSFLSLFSASLIAKDRSGALMLRLLTSPLTASDFIFGYTLPLLPIALVQTIVCYVVALLLRLPLTGNIAVAIVTTIPAAVVYIALGLLCGTLLNDKQVGGVCGALLTNLSAWLSGTWFDLKLMGGGFEKFARMLPFCHATDAGRAALAGEWSTMFRELWWVISYAIVLGMLAVVVFTMRMKRDAK